MSDASHVLAATEGAIATVTISRPEAGNAITRAAADARFCLTASPSF